MQTSAGVTTGGRRSPAIEEEKTTLRLDPSFGVAHGYLGQAYLERNNLPRPSPSCEPLFPSRRGRLLDRRNWRTPMRWRERRRRLARFASNSSASAVKSTSRRTIGLCSTRDSMTSKNPRLAGKGVRGTQRPVSQYRCSPSVCIFAPETGFSRFVASHGINSFGAEHPCPVTLGAECGKKMTREGPNYLLFDVQYNHAMLRQPGLTCSS